MKRLKLSIFFLLCLVLLFNSGTGFILTKKGKKKQSLRSLFSKNKKNILKSLNKGRKRKLMLGEEPPIITVHSGVSPQSMPQIDAPRLFIKNFPKPTNTNYLLPQRNLVAPAQAPVPRSLPPNLAYAQAYSNNNGPPQRQLISPNQGGNSPINFLPPHIVDRQTADKVMKNPNQGLIDMFGVAPQRKKKRKRSRKLNVTPYMHMGPGYMDVAQSGYSPMGLAMANPDLHSMSPFLPRPNPPPPLRIQLRDPVEEKYRRNILTQSEYQVETMKTKKLQNKLINELKGLQTDMENKRKELADQFKEIANTAELIGQHKEEVSTQTKVLKSEIDKQLEEAGN